MNRRARVDSIHKLLSIVLFGSLLTSGFSAAGAHAADMHTPALASPGSGAEVIRGSGPGLSAPLRSIPPAAVQRAAGEINAPNRLRMPKTDNAVKAPSFDASIVQSAPGAALTPGAIANFDGISATGYRPPDTEGDIGYDPASGKKYYMQFVNVSYQIWDVTNPASPISLAGPSLGTSLWSGLDSSLRCHNSNGGDPIVLFDHLANRWFASQLAYASLTSDFHQCIAVSTTADPTGTWNAYDFLWGAGVLNDYPKFAVWPDGYYLSVNQFREPGDVWAGPGAAVFDRAAMLAGSPASMIRFSIPAATGFGGMLPSDLDGPAPAAGTPNYFTEWDNSTWLGDAQDTLRIWQFHVDWTTPGNSTFGSNPSFAPNQLIATANVDPDLCGFPVTLCIPQPGTTQKVDALNDRLMHRMQYRDLGGHQTLVGNHTVDADGAGKAGIHWFELKRSGGSWSMNQQGVYSPDSDNRWMGSVAEDSNGDIALGYSVSSSTTYPSVRYTGRLVGDPAGTLQAEASLIAGGGSQTISDGRWGDYSMMGVDPSDGCTFWYTQEYYQTTSSYGWKTRIGSFAFPSCTPVTRTISGNAGAANARLGYFDVTPKTVTADGSGNYSFIVPDTWSGSVSPFKIGDGFSPASKSYSNVRTDQTAQNFTATAYPTTGTYDDTDAHWGHSGTWVTVPVTGLNNNTLGIGATVGATATFGFYGNGFSLKYLQYANWGKIGVYVDGSATPLTTIDTSGPAGVPTYASPGLIPGPHTVMLKHAGPAGSFIGIDALEVSTPASVGGGVYDDGDPAWSYTGSWVAPTVPGAHDNTLHISLTPSDTATLFFSGTGFSLTYLQYTAWGNIAIFLDGNPTPLATIITAGSPGLPAYTSPTLSPGEHVVLLAHAGLPGKFVALDYVTITP